MKRKHLKPVDYPRGHFTAPVYAASSMHPGGWPPRWEPQYRRDSIDRAALSTATRERTIAQGGWGGKVMGISAAADARPSIAADRLLVTRRGG